MKIKFAFISAALLCGCSLDAPSEPIYVIVTAETPTVESAVIPTQPAESLIELTPLPPTAPPTPTIAPDVALQAADRFRLNGYYERAVEQYRLVIDQGETAPPTIRAAAAFGLGQAALREGFFQDAVDALTLFIQQFPQDTRAAQAHFLRGDAYLGLGLWSEGLADFQTYLTLRPGLIDSYAHERIADAQLALGQQDAALASYSAAVEAGRTLVPLLALRERVAQVYANQGMYAEAVAQYDAILAVARNAPYRATIEYAAALAVLGAGDVNNGVTRLRQIFNDYPDRPEAYQALQTLLAQGQVLDPLAQANVSFFNGSYDETIDLLNQYTAQAGIVDLDSDALLLLGRAYRELGNWDAANVAFQTIIDQYPQDVNFGAALLEQGRTRFLSGDIFGAIDIYLNIADTYNYLPEAAEALWRAGYLYGTNERPQEAQQVFSRLADEHPDTAQARDGLFLAASAAITAGSTSAAEAFYGRLAVITTGEDQAAAYFSTGRLALQRGDTAAANQLFQSAVAADPDGYYSARAQDILQNRPAFESPAGYRFEFDDAADIAEAEAWLRATFGVEQDGALWQLSPALQADPRLVRGSELWTLAAYDAANTEFADLVETYREDGLASYQLAVYLRSIGAYYNAIVAGANIIRAARVGTLDAPPYIARMRYPAYYADLVSTAAERYGFDPLLLLALIRHESLFNTSATAAAGEIGLTQVIPGTGEYIASQLGIVDYQHSSLFRPYAGVEFGAFYLDEQLERFDGNAVAALAGYNAGPGRALNWLTLSGGDPDLFMTTITISSTRLYVQRIYSYFTIYRALYGAES
jgi:soluble lytic murein transglycosylase